MEWKQILLRHEPIQEMGKIPKGRRMMRKLSIEIKKGKERARGETSNHIAIKIFCGLLMIPCLFTVFAAEIGWGFSIGPAAELGRCKIAILQVHLWRDWMPIVHNPGPDRGSPLRTWIRLSLDNSHGGAERLWFRASVLDPKSQSYPILLQLKTSHWGLPDPEAKAYTIFGEEEKRGIANRDHGERIVLLSPGEVRVIELVGSEGPYLPVNSPAHVEILFTNPKGDSVTVKSPTVLIQRTD